jgi:Protein of unknown function (DUF3606)
MAVLTKKTPRRSQINTDDPHEVKYWAHELGIGKAKLRAVIEKVGNAAAAVRKELSSQRLLDHQ